MRLINKLIVIYITFFLPFQVNAQWRDFHFSELGTDDGITNNITGICQDQTGFLYFGTGQGMVRYDGHKFLEFNHDPTDSLSIGAGDVWDIMKGSEGKIWLGLRFGGLNRYDPVLRQFKRFSLPLQNSNDIPSVTAITEDENNDLWVGGHHFQLFKFNKRTESFESYVPDWVNPYTSKRRLAIISAIQDNQNLDHFWLSIMDLGSDQNSSGNINSIVLFDRSTGKFERQNCFGQIFLQDKFGILWGGGFGGGLWKYDPKSNICENRKIEITSNGKTTHHYVRSLLQSELDNFMGTSHSISRWYDDMNYQTILNNEDLGIVSSIFRDRDKNVWFGGSKGIQVINSKQQFIDFYSLSEHGIDQRLYPAKLAFNPIMNTVYLSDNSNRVYQIPLDKKKDCTVLSFARNISAITFSDDQELICIEENQAVLTQSRESWDKYPSIDFSKIRKMEINKEEVIGAISNDRFLWLPPIGEEAQEYRLSEFQGYSSTTSGIKGFSFTQNGGVLLFSEYIYELDKADTIFQLLKLDHSFNPNNLEIRSVIRDTNDSYWIALPGMVGKFENRNDSLLLSKSYKSVDGLRSQWVDKLVLDAYARIWAFSFNGIHCIDTKTNEIRYFGMKEGLPANENDPIQVITVSDNRIASVSGNGLIVFHPDSLWNSLDDSLVPIIINKVSVDGSEMVLNGDPNFIEKITLEPGQNLINIEYQGLSLLDDNHVEYSYKMGGLYEDWISVGKTKQLALQSLQYGNYIFQIKTGKPNSNSPIKSIEIIVQAPFYMKLWFTGLLIVMFLLLIYFSFRYRVSQIMKKEAQKTELNKRISNLELSALRSQMNPHFMFNSLNAIKYYILKSEGQKASEYLSNFSHLIRMILQNSREKTITLQEELDTLISYIELEKMRFGKQFKFQCIIDEGLDLNDYDIPPLILQPYIENAIWHGLMNKSTEGNLSIYFMKTSTGLKCTIDDDGIGRKESMAKKNSKTRQYKSLGMNITRERLDIINQSSAGKIIVEIHDKYDDNGISEGTKIIIDILKEYD